MPRDGIGSAGALGRFRGTLIRPGDPGYEQHRRIVDRRFDARPALIARCAGVSDVRAALKMARDSGLVVAVRSGGHSFPGLSTVDGGIVIDLSLMNDVQVDLERQTARIRPGALGGDIILETVPYGLAPVGGARARVGFGGLAIFNGQGYLAPRYGNAADNIISLEVVLADGRWVRASPAVNENLFWAMRGAGDNFGIVTLFEIRLHPVPVIVTVGTFELEPATVVEALAALEGVDRLLSEDIAWAVKVQRSPSGASSVSIGYEHLGGEAAIARDLDLLQRAAPSARQDRQTISYVDLHYRSGFTGNRTYVAGAQLRSLDLATARQIRTIAERFFADVPTPPGAERSIDFYPISKGLARVPTPPNAWSIRSGYGLTARVSYDEADQEAGHAAWADGAIDHLVAAGVTSGGHNVTALNHVSRWTPECVREAYGESYRRLAALKAKYDPDNLFRRSTNIERLDGERGEL